jgi:hypothetical protein
MRTSYTCYSTVFSQLWARYVATRRAENAEISPGNRLSSGVVQVYVVLLPLPNPIRSQVFGTWQMNEQITALWYSRDEAIYGQAKVAIPRFEWMNEWICVLTKELWPCLFALTSSNIDHFELNLADQFLNNQGTNLCINCPPRLTCVVALPCETQIFSKFASQHNNMGFQKKRHSKEFYNF